MRSHAKVLFGVAMLCGFLALPSSALALFENTGQFAGGTGTGDGEMTRPQRIAVGQSTGKVFVVDGENDRVQVFAPNGNGATYEAQFGSGELDAPYGIAIDQATGDVYVSDSTSVRRYTSALSLDGTWTPLTITGALAFDNAGDRLLVADKAAKEVKAFETDGTPDGSFDGSTSPDGAFTGPVDLAVNSTGDVYVVDISGDGDADGDVDLYDLAYHSPASGGSVTSRVVRFSSVGAHQATLAGLAAPGAVAVDDQDRALVADDENSYWTGANIAVEIFSPADAKVATIEGIPGNYGLITGLATTAGSPSRFYVLTDRSADNAVGQVKVQIYDDLLPPIATVAPATGISTEEATLHGNVDPQGSAAADSTSCRFEYVTDAAFQPRDEVQRLTVYAGEGTYTLTIQGETTGPIPYDAAASTLQAVLVALPTVAPGEIAVVGGPGGPDGGTPYTLTYSGALGGTEINGSLDPGGLNGGYGQVGAIVEGRPANFADAEEIPCDPATVTGAATDVEVSLTGLQPNTTYHFRVVATKGRQSHASAGESFATPATPVVARTEGSATRTATTARLNGRVNPRNSTTTYRFEWGTSAAYGSSAPAGPEASAGADNTFRPVSQTITGLKPDTTYHYRIVATSAEGTAAGEDFTITTRGTDAIGSGVGAEGDRVNELVMEPMGGALETTAVLARDGNRVLYKAGNGYEDSVRGVGAIVVAERGPDGWTRRVAEPPRSALPDSRNWLLPVAMAPNLASYIAASTCAYTGAITSCEKNLFRFDVVDGSFDLLHEGDLSYYGASGGDKAEFVYMVEGGAFVPEDVNGNGDLYELGTGTPKLVSNLPDGEPAACGADDLGWNESSGFRTTADQMVSVDGRTAWFHTSGDDCSAPIQLYYAFEGETTLVSGPALSGPLGKAEFVRANPAGTQVIFHTTTRLDPADSDSDADLYRYTRGAGNECLTCALSDADLLPSFGLRGSAVSEDLSTVFFSSTKALLPGTVPGFADQDGSTPDEFNLYSLRDGELRFIARTDQVVNSYATQGNEVSVAGDVFVFGSRLDETSGDPTGDQSQIYSYDYDARSLTCVSCPDAGSAGAGTLNEGGFAQISTVRSLAEDGSTLVFSTPSSLVQADVNGTRDVYEYRDGRVGLITPGRNPRNVGLWDISDDGEEVLFLSSETLDGPGQVGEDSARYFYVAKVDGGFPQPPSPPAPCVGDTCHGAPTPPPGSPEAGTRGFAGPGNRAVKLAPKCAKGKQRKSRNGKARCVKSEKQRKGKKRNRTNNSDRGAGR